MTNLGRILCRRVSSRALQFFAPTPVCRIATSRLQTASRAPIISGLSIFPVSKSSRLSSARSRRTKSELSDGSANVIPIGEPDMLFTLTSRCRVFLSLRERNEVRALSHFRVFSLIRICTIALSPDAASVEAGSVAPSFFIESRKSFNRAAGISAKSKTPC